MRWETQPSPRNDARSVGEQLGIDWASSPFDIEQFRAGMDVELEHGTRDAETDVTGDDPLLTGKIALAHLREFPDYYTRLARMEAEGPIGARSGLMLIEHRGVAPNIAESAYVAPTAVVCGDVEIGDECRVMFVWSSWPRMRPCAWARAQ